MPLPLWIEVKYINLISNKLDRFHKVSNYTYNFRCPFCLDSKKDKFKSRGYIYPNNGQLKFKCHNCGLNKSFSTFLKELDSPLYEEMKLELLKDSRGHFKKQQDTKKEEKVAILTENEKILKKLTNVKKYPNDHPIKKYLNSREIPLERYENIYFVPRFMEWINSIIPDKFLKSQLKLDEPRLVIPFFTIDKKIFAVTGRSFKKNSIKYITIKFDENQNKIFGLDSVDPSKRVYIVEGPIDSFFIDNCVAFAGSSGNIPKFKDYVIILDNEPRNKEIVRLLSKFIDQGKNVCIWPKDIKEKDINEMIINGYSKEQIKEIIDNNTFNNLTAKLKFSEWKVISKDS